MLHILLLILKIIGIILAVILGLLLLITGVILFVPVRYRGKARREENVTAGRVKVSWLLHAATFTIKYENGKTIQEIRLFGVRIQKWKAFFSGKKKIKRKKIPKKAAAEETQKRTEVCKPENAENRIEVQKPAETQNQVELQKNEEAQKSGNRAANKTDREEKDYKVHTIKKMWHGIRSLPGKMVSAVRFLLSIPFRFLRALKKMHFTMERICDKMNYWKEFLKDERTRAALVCLKEHLLRILKHILPKRLYGELHFGFEDPASTGQVLGAVYMIYPNHPKHLRLCPDFEQQIMEGHIELKGRIYLFCLLWQAMKIWFDKNFQFAFNIIRHKEEF